MAYKKGDKVIIMVPRVPNIGVEIRTSELGTILQVSGEAQLSYFVSYEDHIFGKSKWWFGEEHLGRENYASPVTIIPAPEFDLEDMELAEIIIEEMK